MKVVAVVVVLGSTSPSFAERQIVDNNASITVDCKTDSEVSLVGNNLTVTLVGNCTRVNVTGNHERVSGSAAAFFIAGNHNTVTVDTTDDITLAGNHNTVTWKKSGKGTPRIANPGKDNKISQAR